MPGRNPQSRTHPAGASLGIPAATRTTAIQQQISQNDAASSIHAKQQEWPPDETPSHRTATQSPTRLPNSAPNFALNSALHFAHVPPSWRWGEIQYLQVRASGRCREVTDFAEIGNQSRERCEGFGGRNCRSERRAMFKRSTRKAQTGSQDSDFEAQPGRNGRLRRDLSAPCRTGPRVVCPMALRRCRHVKRTCAPASSPGGAADTAAQGGPHQPRIDASPSHPQIGGAAGRRLLKLVVLVLVR